MYDKMLNRCDPATPLQTQIVGDCCQVAVAKVEVEVDMVSRLLTSKTDTAWDATAWVAYLIAASGEPS